jgi:hypothetical protein
MRSRVLRAALIAALAILSTLAVGVAAASAESPTGSISGRVVDSVSGLPLAGCRVYLVANDSWGTTYTDTGDDGHYEFDNLAAGQYSALFWMMSDPLHVEWTAYHDHDDTSSWDDVALATDSSTVVFDDQHIRPYCEFTGNVTTHYGGPAAATVVAWKSNGLGAWTNAGQASTDGSGNYELIVPKGTYHLSFSGSGLSPKVWPAIDVPYVDGDHLALGQDATVTADGEVKSGFDATLSLLGKISAKARDSNFDELGDGTVDLYRQNDITLVWEVWDQGPFGTYFSSLPVGNYRLYYHGQPGYYDCWYSSSLFSSGATTIWVLNDDDWNIWNPMFGSSRVTGLATNVVTSSGVGSVTVDAQIWDGSEWQSEGTTQTAADGSWYLDVPLGRYRFAFTPLIASGLAPSYYTAGGSVETSVDVWRETPLDGVDQALLPLDVSAPVTTPTYSSAWTSGVATVSLAATDGPYGSGVASTWYQVGSADTTHTYVPGGQIDVNAEGTTTVSFGSVDRLGHVETTKTATVRVDHSPPVAEMRVTSTPGDALVSLDASDALSGLARIAYRVDTGDESTYTVPFHLGVGRHSVGYRALDAVGNPSAWTTQTVTVASPLVAPRLTTPALSPSKPKHKKTFTISGRIGSVDAVPTTIVLTIQRKSGGKMKPFAIVRATLRANSLAYSVKTKISKAGSYRVQASHAQDAAHLAGVSAWKSFTVK